MADIGQIALVLLLGSLIAWGSFRLGGDHQMREIGMLRATKQEIVEQMLREELAPEVRNQLLEEEKQDVRDILEEREREDVSALMKQRLFVGGAAFGMRESYERGKRDGWEEVMDETRGARRWAHGQVPFGRTRRAYSPRARRENGHVDPGPLDTDGGEPGGYRTQAGRNYW